MYYLLSIAPPQKTNTAQGHIYIVLKNIWAIAPPAGQNM